MVTALRCIGATLAIVGLLSGTGCGSTTSPAPTAAAANPLPTSAPAPKQVATSAPAPTKPAEPSAATPAGSANWKAEWDKLVATGNKEGRVVISGGTGDMYRDAALAFQKAYPEIKVEFTGMRGSTFAPKVLAEREGGQYLWDVAAGGSSNLMFDLKPKGALDPLKPALLLPEVLDADKWVGGYEDGWMDKEHQYVFAFEGRLTYVAYVNRDLVPESELNSLDQLLDPKWKGKIIWADPRGTGVANAQAKNLLVYKGEDWLRKLFAQDIELQKEGRPVAEAVVRGRNPVAMGIDAYDIEPFMREGAATHVKPLEPNTLAGGKLTSGQGHLVVMNRPPHPNAAMVYINWLLSKEGQQAYVAATNLNSRRADVEGPPEYASDPRVGRINLDKEELEPYKNRTNEIANEMLK